MDSPVSVPPPKPEGPARASDLLVELLDAFPNESVTVGEVLERLEGRAFGLLLLLLALPNCVPNIPGLSTIFGVMMIAPAVQLILGRGALWLPKRVRAWSFSRDILGSTIKAAVPLLRKVESLIKPRWHTLVSPPFTRLLGLQVLVMAFILILPIWGGNWPPGVTVAAVALALLQGDGRLALLSIPMAIASAVAAWFFFWVGYEVLSALGGVIKTRLDLLF
jgi:hypothetical protein